MPGTDEKAVTFVGYYSRSSLYAESGDLMPFLLQDVLILGAPSVFAAWMYITRPEEEITGVH
jgi:hypothetical protein